MKITVRIDDSLHAQLKQWARETGSTLSEAVEAALREALLHIETKPKADPVALVTAGEGGRLAPGANLDCSDSLLDLMEQITPENLHGEIDFGPPRGKEVW